MLTKIFIKKSQIRALCSQVENKELFFPKVFSNFSFGHTFLMSIFENENEVLKKKVPN